MSAIPYSLALCCFLLYLQTSAQSASVPGCLRASNGSRPLPNFVRPGSGREPRFENTPIQAIITSYRFNCYGVITEWRAFVEGSGGGQFNDQPYSISFQVWRPSSPTNTYTLIGVNHFFPIPLADPDTADRGIVTGRPTESERIEVQPGDVVGFYFKNRRDNNDGIQFARDGDNTPNYRNEDVWLASGRSVINPSTSTSLAVGVGHNLASSISRAPLITVTFSQMASPESPTSTVAHTGTTPGFVEPTQPSSMTFTDHTPTLLPPTPTDSSTQQPPRHTTTSAPPLTSSGGNIWLIAGVAVALTTIIAIVTLTIATIMLARVKRKRNKQVRAALNASENASGLVMVKNKVELNEAKLIKEPKYDYPYNTMADPRTFQNPAYGDITTTAGGNQYCYINEGLDGAANVRMTRNQAYTGVRQPSSNNEPSITTKENEAYTSISADPGRRVEPENKVRMTRNEAYTGVRQSSSNNELSITTKENEAYTSISADPGRRVEPENKVRMTRNEAYTGVRQSSSNNELSIATKENEAYTSISADPRLYSWEESRA